MVIICLSSDQWKRLEPHLPEEGVCTKSTEDNAFPSQHCEPWNGKSRLGEADFSRKRGGIGRNNANE
jgi:hypothetical protein